MFFCARDFAFRRVVFGAPLPVVFLILGQSPSWRRATNSRLVAGALDNPGIRDGLLAAGRSCCAAGFSFREYVPFPPRNKFALFCSACVDGGFALSRSVLFEARFDCFLFWAWTKMGFFLLVFFRLQKKNKLRLVVRWNVFHKKTPPLPAAKKDKERAWGNFLTPHILDLTWPKCHNFIFCSIIGAFLSEGFEKHVCRKRRLRQFLFSIKPGRRRPDEFALHVVSVTFLKGTGPPSGSSLDGRGDFLFAVFAGWPGRGAGY